jgi:PIN domain nuclease of toxin-antitoxin system
MDPRPVKVLTDTHTLVWALTRPEKLGKGAMKALETGMVSTSVVNLWELILKANKPGALVSGPLPWWDKYVVRTGITTLPVRLAHVRALGELADIHQDPFDRILVAQAIAEGMVIVSKDKVLKNYGVEVVWK